MRQDVFTLDAHAWALAANGRIGAGARGHGTRARPGHRGRPPVPPRGGHRPAAGRRAEARALAEEGRAPARDAPAVRAPRSSHDSSIETPSMRRVDMKNPMVPSAAHRRSGRAPAGRRWRSKRVESHGRAAHHARRRRQYHRRVRVRPGAERQQGARDRARRVPLRGAGHRAQQVQLRRRTCSIKFTSQPAATWRPGGATFTYEFRFTTRFKNTRTILQSYLGVVKNVDDAAQNLTQFYTVTQVDQPERSPRAARPRRRSAEQPGHRHAVLQPGRQRREPAHVTASRQSTSSIATRSSRLPRSMVATSRSRASATMGSSRTSRRSSICCSCGAPARTRRRDSTCT